MSGELPTIAALIQRRALFVANHSGGKDAPKPEVARRVGRAADRRSTGRRRQMSDAREPRLDERDKEEWREVARLLRPDWTEQQFEEAWTEFVEMKRRKGMQ